MTMTTAMPSSQASSSSPSKTKRGLLGPRPRPLKVASSSSKKPSSSSRKAGAAPVIVYEHTPKVVHARPQEFMTVVQRLTGKPAPTARYSTAACVEGGDPLLLTLGQGPAAPVLPSPMAAGLLMSPSFIFSPNTMQSIQELSPLF